MTGVALSVFDLFSIGIGPSSSHTVGPMRAAVMFAERVREDGLLDRVARVKAELFGSLGATGHGHGSATAVLLGLSGERPEHCQPREVAGQLEQIRGSGRLSLLGTHEIDFAEDSDLVLHRTRSVCDSDRRHDPRIQLALRFVALLVPALDLLGEQRRMRLRIPRGSRTSRDQRGRGRERDAGDPAPT